MNRISLDTVFSDGLLYSEERFNLYFLPNSTPQNRNHTRTRRHKSVSWYSLKETVSLPYTVKSTQSPQVCPNHFLHPSTPLPCPCPHSTLRSTTQLDIMPYLTWRPSVPQFRVVLCLLVQSRTKKLTHLKIYICVHVQ